MSGETDGQRCVANMLRRANAQDNSSTQHDSLTALMQRVDHFFASAQSAPAPVNLEEAQGAEDEMASGETELVLNVVAGVLEEKPVCRLQSVDGVVLPTTLNEQQLKAEKMGESIALLNLMAALSGRTTNQGVSDKKVKRRENGDDDDDASSSSSGCAIMDASSGSDDDDGAGEPARRRVTEM